MNTAPVNSFSARIAGALDSLLQRFDYLINKRAIILIPLLIAGVLLPVLGKLNFYSDKFSDFSQDYFAGMSLSQGMEIYGSDITKAAAKNNVGYTTGDEIVIDNFHPPANAVFFSLVAGIHYPTVFYIFSAISWFSYLIIINYALKSFNVLPGTKVFLIIALIYWSPFYDCLMLGQLSSFIALAAIAAFELSRNKKSIFAGLMLGAVSQFKLYPMYLALYFLNKKDYAAFLTAVLSFIMFSGLTIAYLGLDPFLLYFNKIAPEDVNHWGAYPLNVSIGSVFLALLTDNRYYVNSFNQPKLASAIICLLSLSIVFLNLFKKNYLDETHRFYFFVTGMLLLSPIMWNHFFMVLLPLFCSWAFSRNKPPQLRMTVLICFVLTFIDDIWLMNQIVNYYTPSRIPISVLIPSKVYFASTLILFSFLYILKSGKEESAIRISQ